MAHSKAITDMKLATRDRRRVQPALPVLWRHQGRPQTPDCIERQNIDTREQRDEPEPEPEPKVEVEAAGIPVSDSTFPIDGNSY